MSLPAPAKCSAFLSIPMNALSVLLPSAASHSCLRAHLSFLFKTVIPATSLFYCINFPFLLNHSHKHAQLFKKKILSTSLHLSVTVLFTSISLHDTVAYIPSLRFVSSHSFVTPFQTGFALTTSPVLLLLRLPCPVSSQKQFWGLILLDLL